MVWNRQGCTLMLNGRHCLFMINYGSIYLIVKDFDKSLEFYKDFLEMDICAQNQK